METNRRAYIEAMLAIVPDMNRRSEGGIRNLRQFLRQSNWKKLKLLRKELEEFLQRQPTPQ